MEMILYHQKDRTMLHGIWMNRILKMMKKLLQQKWLHMVNEKMQSKTLNLKMEHNSKKMMVIQ